MTTVEAPNVVFEHERSVLSTESRAFRSFARRLSMEKRSVDHAALSLASLRLMNLLSQAQEAKAPTRVAELLQLAAEAIAKASMILHSIRDDAIVDEESYRTGIAILQKVSRLVANLIRIDAADEALEPMQARLEVAQGEPAADVADTTKPDSIVTHAPVSRPSKTRPSKSRSIERPPRERPHEGGGSRTGVDPPS